MGMDFFGLDFSELLEYMAVTYAHTIHCSVKGIKGIICKSVTGGSKF